MSSIRRLDDKVASLLGELRERDIRIHIDGDSLRIRGARANLTAELTQRIHALKGELIIFLRAAEHMGQASERIPRRADDAPLHLSFMQQNLWLIDQLEGSVHYNMAVPLHVEGLLDVPALERALTTIVQRHESLRTVFRVHEDGTPRQVVLADGAFALEQVDLGTLTGADRDTRVRALCNEEARRPFDLAHDLMMRARLLRLAPDHHVLLVTQHHIASDGWSMDVLLEEMCRLYEAFHRGDVDPLPPLAIQYADYSQWLAQWLVDDVLEAKLAYWQRQLANLPPLHGLPLDRPRPPYRTINGGRHTRLYSLRHHNALLALCNEQDVTLFMLLEAAFAVFLARWSGETDIAVATPISSRSRPELAPMIGYFTNTLVLRSRCEDETGFLDFLRQSRQMMLDAHEHHHIPFEVLVDKLNPTRSLAHNALVQISFKLQNNKASTAGTIELADGVRIYPVSDNEQAQVKFDLELTVKETRAGLQARWDFNTDLFDRATIERMDRHFECLLDSIAADPQQALAQLPMLPDDEAARIRAWNDTQVDFPAQDTLASLFQAQVAATPDHPALVFSGGALSYAELNARANRLAHRLIAEHGVGPGVMVGHYVERSWEMMVAVLAIAKAGGAYVALDPGLPSERLAYMLGDSAAPLVLAQSHLVDDLPTLADVRVLCVDTLDDAAFPAHDPALRASADDLAYVIYTSGSTGRPKGTLNHHRGVCNRLQALQREFGLHAADRVLQKTPLSFDVSVWELFWPLAAGATLVLAVPEGHKDPQYLARTIADEGITTLHFVPSMLQAFVREAGSHALPSLRYLITSGEALGYELQAQCIALFPHVRKINQYGPTEAAIDVTRWCFDALRADRCVPIGRPGDNVRIHILDRQGRQVPVGVAGELFIGGVQVGAGYLNNAELTAQRFCERVIDGQSERLYQTGDRARWLDDGQIEYLGRLDHQVKLRGFRIELGEIEACLDEQPGVDRCVVVLWDRDGAQHQRLVAYLVPPAGGEPDEATLRAALRERLPEYMVPAQFVCLPSLPLTPSGKVDRRALPAPVRATAEADSAQPPSTPIEEILLGLWAQVLPRAPEGVNAHFFELGGHSLMATQLASAIRREFAVEMPLKAVFEHPVLKEQAQWLAQQQRGHVLPPISAHAPCDYVLSYAQQRLWLLAQLEGTGSTYNIPRTLRLSGALDVDALERAFATLVQRHANLRLSFPRRCDLPCVGLLETYRPLRVVDLSGLAAEVREPEFARLAREHACHRFDLAGEPLLRAQLLRLDEQDHALLVNLHHIVGDGWSIGVMMREISELYGAYAAGQPDPLPPLTIQYPDYAIWQRQWLAGEVLATQRDYWRAQLADAPTLLPLPTDRPRPAHFSYRGTHYRAALAPALRDGLLQVSRRHGCTAFMTVLAAFDVLLARYSGQDDLCVGTPIANRTHHQAEPLIGCFINTLVLRNRVQPGDSFAQLLAQVRRTALDAYNYQDLPFEQLVEDLKPERSLAHSPLFQVMFRYENGATARVALPGVEISEVASRGDTAQFDLLLNVIEGGDSLQCEWEYATDLFDAATIARMHGHLEALLAAIVADLDAPVPTPVGQLPWWSPGEREALLALHAPQPAATPSQPLHRLFEAQAAVRPTATALSVDGQAISYDALNRRANRIAHRLIALGVGPDDRVALCVQRGTELIAGLLGILKAGAAYVPLDPAQPAQRLAWILEDSTPVALLTQAALAEALPATSLPLLLIDADDVSGAATTGQESNPACPQLGMHHLAYVIYTSGSTGQPKGVLVEHRQAARLLSATRHWFDFDANDTWSLFHSVAFDFSVWEIWGALAHGGRLVVVPAACARSPREFYELLCREQVTVLNQTPSAFRALIAAQADSDSAHALRLVVFGGEALELHALRPWLARNDLDRTRLVNMYGITETTVHVSYRPLAREDILAGQGSVIGCPIPDMRIRILDAHMQPVPIGVPGEMYVGGAGVARGYLHRPELTQQRFLADPFAPGERLYRSGDLARWTGDGDIEYLGRNDFQVKVRGFRIELGEIESRLTGCAGVREAVVVAREDSPGDKRLVAYLVAHDGVELVAAQLRDALVHTLAEYMLPSAFVVLDALPLTSNGKLDRRALPAPDQASAVQRDFEAPVGAIEQALAQTWCELLGLQQVGRHDHFFELGGHSLLVIGMIERLRRQGLETDVRAVFTANSLQALARAVTLRPGDASAPHTQAPASRIDADTRALTPDCLPMLALEQAQVDALVAAVPGGVANIQDAYPLAPLQEGILFHHLRDERQGGDDYLMRTLLAFATRERLDDFLAAVQAVIDRHDILRSGVHWKGLPRPVQVVQRQARLPVRQLDVAAGEDALGVLSHHTDPRGTHLDLRAAPLLAAVIAQDSDSGGWLLALLNHHIVEDNYSRQLMLREVHALLEGRGDTLPEPRPYRDFIAAVQADSPDRHEAYFREQLADIDEPTVPFAGVAPVPARDAQWLLEAPLARALRTAAQQCAVAPAVLFHVAWAQVLAMCSGCDDVVFGTVLSGRLQSLPEAGEVVGMFINTLPIRVQLHGRDAARAVRETHASLGALLEHEQAPLALAQRCSGLPASVPLFNTLLNYRHTRVVDADMAARGLAGVRVIGSQESSNYPLALAVADRGEDFALIAQSALDVAPERLVQYVCASLRGLLQALDAADATPLTALPLLPADEQAHLLQGLNATAAPQPEPLPLAAWFERQVRVQPQAPAVVDAATTLDYAELNRQANRIAHRLLALGVQPDDRVALCVERDAQSLVGLLGILKAGAAYVPLDPAHPHERLAWLLQDCAPKAVLTQQPLRDRLAADVPVLCLDDADNWAGQGEHDPVVPTLAATHLAYVIYTSGSTGRPKGVMVEHRNVLNLWAALEREAFGACDPQAAIGLNAGLAFDASLQSITQLLSGRCVVIVPAAARADGAAMVEFVARHRLQALDCTPAQFELMSAYGLLDAGRTGLRCLLVGGEAISSRAWAQAAASKVRCFNVYGPTECTVDATIAPITPGRGAHIGRPLANTRAYVLDRRGRPAPVDVTGELHIAGAGVARGYWNRDGSEAARFTTDPFVEDADAASARMYRTGDLARWTADGVLEYLGRNDTQLKLRGHRIEAGEIQARLLECPGVRDALALVREVAEGDQRLLAYVVAAADTAPDPAALRARLQVQLPEPMVPAAIVVLAQWPLTANGKIDRRALPALGQIGLASEHYVAPIGPTEAALAQLWEQVLKVERVGRHDNFFDLGGHSLLATQLLVRLNDRFALDLPLATLFERPTLAALAQDVLDLQLATLEGDDSAWPDADRLDRYSDLSVEELQRLLQEEVL